VDSSASMVSSYGALDQKTFPSMRKIFTFSTMSKLVMIFTKHSIEWGALSLGYKDQRVKTTTRVYRLS